MVELLTKSIGLLFAIEGQKFQLIKFDPPFIYANTGVFQVAKASIVNQDVEITMYDFECEMPCVDWFILAFIDKKKTNDDSANIVLLKNDESFKAKMRVSDLIGLIKYKTWIDII